MFGACLPLYGALLEQRPVGILDFTAFAVCCSAVAIELVADRQMDAFQEDKRCKRTHAAVIDRGLWMWSRHPNYFGEASWWWGVWLFAAHAAPWWVICGPIAMTSLFLGISVKLMEDRQLANKGEKYREYMRRVPSDFLPVPPLINR